MTDEPLAPANGNPLSGDVGMAGRATKMIAFEPAMQEFARKILEAGGAVGHVSFMLYPDGSIAIKNDGKMPAHLVEFIAGWGLNSLSAYVRKAEQQMVAVKAFAMKNGVTKQ